MKRLFDICASLPALILLSPLFLLISLVILLGSKGGVFYRQQRVGRNGKPFLLFKFRSMRPQSDKGSLITIGGRDNRITREGYFLRKYKLDELPQLLNIIRGDMSIVGPRPEVQRYVDLYTPEQKKVLSVRPGLTDWASIEYMDENELLGKSSDPEYTYIHEIMPAKLELNLRYIREAGLLTDLKIIFLTIFKIFR
ncbi:MAG: sugar transferase [Bacteroidia bacterium]|nr:sugar transferase [Bacteroidia bacterium]